MLNESAANVSKMTHALCEKTQHPLSTLPKAKDHIHQDHNHPEKTVLNPKKLTAELGNLFVSKMTHCVKKTQPLSTLPTDHIHQDHNHSEKTVQNFEKLTAELGKLFGQGVGEDDRQGLLPVVQLTGLHDVRPVVSDHRGDQLQQVHQHIQPQEKNKQHQTNT